MKRWMPLALLLGATIFGCAAEPTAPTTQTTPEGDALAQHHGSNNGKFVIANRGSGTISVIDERTHDVVGTFDLPTEAGDPTPEPMYVVYNRNRVFVGDRANDRVAVFDARSYTVEGTVAAGRGVFHMWANPNGKRLWVNNDIDNTTTVIDTRSLSVLATVDTPNDLVALGGKPHDVITGPFGVFAYVTVLGVSGDDDYVVQYDARQFEETGRAAVGKDPHVSLARQHRKLYVPCQNSNVVVVLDRFSMDEITRIDVPGAHGAAMSPNGKYFYTANLPGGGTDALFTINTRNNRVVGDAVDSPYPVPHNIALNRNGRKLALTHSGATSDKVTLYRSSHSGRSLSYRDEVTVGLNPFGLAYVPR